MEALARGHKNKAGEWSPPSGAAASSRGLGPPPALTSTFPGLPEWKWHPHVKRPHTPACQRLRDIPDPLFGSGSYPLPQRPKEAVSGGKVLSQRGECPGSRPWLGPGQKTQAGPLREERGWGLQARVFSYQKPLLGGGGHPGPRGLVTVTRVGLRGSCLAKRPRSDGGGGGLLLRIWPPPSLGSALSAV